MPDFTSNDGNPAVRAENTAGGFGAVCISAEGKALEARTDTGQAIVGTATTGTAIIGTSDGFGVVGISNAGKAIEGRTETGQAITGTATTGTAVLGTSDGFGVVGVSDIGKAIEGRTKTGRAITGIASEPSGRAGFFDGDVEVTKDLILTGSDVAEQFDVAARADGIDEATAGTVVVLDDEGALAPCTKAYDTRVVGVVSGAGDRMPALILDRKEQCENASRRAVAVVGKAWCRADASCQPIEVGDLLTTSTIRGHAMAAVDRQAAFGAVIGKALTPLRSNSGLVLVLVGLG